MRHAQVQDKSNIISCISSDLIRAMKPTAFSATPLSGLGKRQCEQFAHMFEQHTEHITYILCSPIPRAQETALRALYPATRSGVPVQHKGQLSGRGSEPSYLYGAWRVSPMCDVAYILHWLGLHDENVRVRTKMREVVIVTHGQFLQSLFGRSEFPAL
jgi:broad specificity phosphatase PhoE